MKITIDGKYTTRDGRAVRILCVDGPGYYPVIGIVKDARSADEWDAHGRWNAQVEYGETTNLRDLIPAKPEPVVEVEWGGYNSASDVFAKCQNEDHARDFTRLHATQPRIHLCQTNHSDKDS